MSWKKLSDVKIKQSTKVNVVKYEMTVIRFRNDTPGSNACEAEAGDPQRPEDIPDDGKSAGSPHALNTHIAIPGGKQEE